MSTKLSLMSLPHEILLMILTFYFSNTAVNVRNLERPTRQNTTTASLRPIPISMAVLLVNKILLQLGLTCHYENTTVWCDAIFNTGGHIVMSWAYQQMPWRSYKHIAVSPYFSYRFAQITQRGILPIQHLREIDLHYAESLIFCTHHMDLLLPDNDDFARLCQVNNIRFRTFMTIWLIRAIPGPVAPRPECVATLKMVRAGPSLDLYEAEIHHQDVFLQWEPQLEQAWGLDLPLVQSSQPKTLSFRSQSIEWCD